MVNHDEEPSTFASGAFGTLPKRRKGRRIRRYIAMFIVGLLLPMAYFGWRDFYDNFLERELPEIVFERTPIGLGLDPIQIRFTVRDLHSERPVNVSAHAPVGLDSDDPKKA